MYSKTLIIVNITIYTLILKKEIYLCTFYCYKTRPYMIM